MSNNLFTSAVDFLYRNARLLEKHRLAYHFFSKPQFPVLRSLHAYQNLDGGFGNALEPDKRYPGSTPIDVASAFEILDEVNGFTDPMILRACDYLLTITTEEGGIPLTLPAVKDYPSAPWWLTDESSPPASVNPTAEICGLLLKHSIEHPWLEKAIAFCWQNIDPQQSSYHDMMPLARFLQHAPGQSKAGELLAEIKQAILDRHLVAFDRAMGGYVQFPLQWAPTPQHPFRSLFSEQEIENDLQALRAAQLGDGGWGINWQPVSKAVELEWRGILTLKNLMTLKAYESL
jgi:hypothetical protein